jgi:hypothetical protein
MGVSVGRSPQEVLSKEFYMSGCSETVQVGRVRVFEEFPTVFNCGVLTFRSAIKFHREYRTPSTLQYIKIFPNYQPCQLVKRQKNQRVKDHPCPRLQDTDVSGESFD